MRLYSVVFLWLCSICCILCHNTQTQFLTDAKQTKVITPELSKQIEKTLETYRVPGMSAAVIRKDGTVELGAWGQKTEDGDATTPSTLYYIGSCSKAFTSAAMGILMDDFAHDRNITALPSGVTVFDWNTKVGDLLPNEWALQDEWASKKASIRDILAHVSGLRSHDLSYSPYDTPAEIVSSLRHLRPAYELREQYHYNNHMYIVAAHIISTYTGSYENFVKERIFDPLDMSATTFSLSEALNTGEMTQAWSTLANGRRIPHWMDDDVMHNTVGAGGIISSVVDMAKWVELLLNSGHNPRTNTAIIPRAAFEQITSAQVVADSGPVAGYCAGWIRENFLGRDIVWHNGGLPGFYSRLAFLPDKGVGLIQLLNMDFQSQTALDIQKLVFERYLDLEHASDDSEKMASADGEATDTLIINETVLSLSVGKFSGTYSHPAYGNLTFCGPDTPSTYCEETRANFAPFNFGTAPHLVAAWPRVWSSHVRVVFVDKQNVDVTFYSLFPEGYGADDSPFTMAWEIGLDRNSSFFTLEDQVVSGFQLKTDRGEGDAWFKKIL